MLDDVYILQLFREADGDLFFKNPPKPMEEGLICRPYVALIEAINSEIVRFFICDQTNEGHNLGSLNYEALPDDAVVEVRHGGNDYRYYRQQKGIWRRVAIMKYPMMLEVFLYGAYSSSYHTLVSEDRLGYSFGGGSVLD
ncbi:MAG: hypothetical protein ACW99U_10885 [Candidatus Thorarchaeota archaeon]